SQRRDQAIDGLAYSLAGDRLAELGRALRGVTAERGDPIGDEGSQRRPESAERRMLRGEASEQRLASLADLREPIRRRVDELLHERSESGGDGSREGLTARLHQAPDDPADALLDLRPDL